MEGRAHGWKDLPGEENAAKVESLKAEVISKYESGELYEWVNAKLPDWVVSEHPEYTIEFKNMSDNWGKIMTQIQAPKKSILRVRNICLMDKKKEFTILNEICEGLTKLGYVVKYYKHFVPCEGCNRIMASKHVQEKLWGPGNSWSKCKECHKQ